jgi:hypothetical protein
MGDVADMMLEGILCESCGEYLGDGDGYPVSCFGCSEYERTPLNPPPLKKKQQHSNEPHPDGNRAFRRNKKFGRIKDGE